MAKKIKKLNEVEPGDKQEYEPSDDYVHPEHQQHMPSPEKLAKAKELQDKMESLRKELEELQELMWKKQNERREAEREKEELANIDPKLIKIASAIRRDCSYAVSAMREANGFLYRGVRGEPPLTFLGKPRTDRMAKDSSAEIQERFDAMLKESGFTALRSNSIFCSGNFSQANGYGGNVFMIFPKDGFHFTWSPRYDDLYSDLLSNLYHKGFDSLFESNEFSAAKSNLIDEIGAVRGLVNDIYFNMDYFIDANDPDDFFERNNLPDQLKSIALRVFKNKDTVQNIAKKAKDLCMQLSNTIMSRNEDGDYTSYDRLIGPNYEKELIALLQMLRRLDGIHIVEMMGTHLRYSKIRGGNRIITKNLLDAIKEFEAHVNDPKMDVNTVVREKLRFNDNNFLGALQSGNEICVASEYYAVSYNTFGDDLKKILGIATNTIGSNRW